MGELYLKWLRPGRVSPFQRVTWPDPGTWLEAEGPLTACGNGVHVCNLFQSPRWLDAECWLVHCEGDKLDAGDKFVFRRARLVEQITSWDTRAARLFGADCAEHVLPIFQLAQPDDDRPASAIAAARSLASSTADDLTWAATRYAAEEAVSAALRAAKELARMSLWSASEAAQSAAESAVVWQTSGAAAAASGAAITASGAATRASHALGTASVRTALSSSISATYAAARNAESHWQANRLNAYLGGIGSWLGEQHV